MRVLVTGATGFVGRHLVPRLLLSGHEVVAVARDERRARAFEWFERVRFIAFDCHQAAAGSFAQLHSPDAAIHLAWPGLPNYKALFHFETNLAADYRFLKTLVESGLRHLLVTGTCLEYGMQSGALSEELPTAPANPYALAKDSLRRFLLLLRQEHPFILQWARLFYMHGPGQNPNSLLAQLDRAIDGGETQFNMSGGEQLRDYLPISEVASRLARLIERPQADGVFNICSGQPLSVRRLVERHAAQRGASIALNLGHFPYPDYEPLAFWGNGRRFDAAVTPCT